MVKFIDCIRAIVLVSLLATAAWTFFPGNADSATTQAPTLEAESNLLVQNISQPGSETEQTSRHASATIFLFGTGLISAAGFMKKFNR